MKSRQMKSFLAVALIWILGVPALHAKLNVVATLPDLGSVAEAVGGDQVNVISIARGGEDPHFVDARPSHIVKLNKADLLIDGGIGLEAGWLPSLVNNARNRKILPGAVGRLNASLGVALLDIPTGPIDRSQGDVHAGGNPHYMLDPMNAKVVAGRIAVKLAELDPEHADLFEENAKQFSDRIDQKFTEWQQRMAGMKGTKVVTYHKSFDYFLNRFGMTLVATVEPKPGIEPSPTHINSLIPLMQQEKVTLMMIETHRPKKTPTYVAKATGASLVFAPLMVGEGEATGDYFALMDHLVALVLKAKP